MTWNGNWEDAPDLTPDEAFVALGNEVRVQALQVLGQAESPLSFTELRERVGIEDPGQFNYHLDKLRGHFIRQVGDKYALRETGSRVVQAVLSGSVTGTASLEPTPLEAPCPYCGASIQIQFAEERVLARCTQCPGTYAGSQTDARFLEEAPHGTIGFFLLPPAGLHDRTPREILDAAVEWTYLEILALANGICSRCSSRVEQNFNVCEDHDAATGVCGNCNRRHAVLVDYDCTNCTKVEERIPIGLHLLSKTELQSFASNLGINLTRPSWEDNSFLVGYEERDLKSDQFVVRLIYVIDGEQIELTVDEDLDVIETDS